MNERDRPDKEKAPPKIEVTPEMIDAGIESLCDYDPGWSSDRDTVREIFIAMASRCEQFRIFSFC